MQHWDYQKGWCLKEDKEVDFSFFRDVWASPFFCPHCGEISEHYKESYHVFSPSGPLLSRLRRTVE